MIRLLKSLFTITYPYTNPIDTQRAKALGPEDGRERGQTGRIGRATQVSQRARLVPQRVGQFVGRGMAPGHLQ